MYPWLLIGAVSVVVAYSFRGWVRTRLRLIKLAARMPGPPAWPLLGNALFFMATSADLLDVLSTAVKQYGEYVRFWVGPELMVCVKNPADIRLLLTSNKINIKGPFYEFMKVFIGPGVLSEGGPVWRNHRKIAHPSYSKKTVQRYATVFNSCAEDLVADLRKKNPDVTFNVYWDVVRFTTQCVCQTIVGLSKEETGTVKSMDDILNETHNMYDFVFTNMTRWWLHIPVVYWLLGRKTTERYYLRLIDEMTSDMLARRRKALSEKTLTEEELGVVDRFILSGELTDQEIKWEIMTFFTASQEASAKIAAAALLILAHLPEWQEKVYNEIVEVLGEDGYVTGEDVRRLQCLDMVYKEAIRYMPIAAFIQRTVEEEITIKNDITLPAGVTVVIPIHPLHRDPKYWDEPDLVKPERFLPENVRKRDPNAYVPFSLGAMDCIGRIFAESMIKIMVVHVVRHTRLVAAGSMEALPLHVAISVRSAHGYNLRAIPRGHS
ncbi:cytochrome P450 4C1-like isoform X2 [Pectinophora gossypiella]|uniref:cytochrome P450 4C1-like isoform X2 n=1 Tax=Pectinophora gossypiella TaxID=13191 RepID=UPI00214E9B5C|nr:cytochrome P450 4C1-like isoform X2 [Pectinophora gossypiella]